MKLLKTLPESDEALYRIQRALAGHVSYLAACETNVTFSEYILYEPIFRILVTRGYTVQCEFRCPGIPNHAAGDHKRVDFEATKANVRFALEVKWPRNQVRRTLNVKADHIKLAAFHKNDPASYSFLCVFGRYEHIKNIVLSPDKFTEHLPPIYALFRRTQFGCRIFELKRT